MKAELNPTMSTSKHLDDSDLGTILEEKNYDLSSDTDSEERRTISKRTMFRTYVEEEQTNKHHISSYIHKAADIGQLQATSYVASILLIGFCRRCPVGIKQRSGL